MPSLSLNVGLNNGRKLPFTGGAVPTPTAVLISGAGSELTDGLYSWDGVTLTNGKPQYVFPQGGGSNFLIDWYDIWVLSLDGGDSYYRSYNLVNWEIGDIGDGPTPTGTLSYS